MAEKRKRNRPSKPWFLVGGIAIGIGVFAVVMSLVFMQKNQTTAKVSTRGTAPRTIKGDPGGKGTPEYNRKLAELKEQEAANAAAKGESYIPPVTHESDVNADLEAMLRTTEPPEEISYEIDTSNATATPLNRREREQQQQEDPETVALREYQATRADLLHKAYLDSMGRIAERMILTPHSTVVYDTASLIAQARQEEARQAEVLQAQSATEEPSIDLTTGDILYAVVDQFLNSDAHAPAFLATVISGPHKGSILVGTFTRQGESLALVFSRIRTPDKKVFSIEAYAVDPESTDGRLASSVNRHTVTRWGGVIVSSLLKGWQKAVETSGDQVIYTGDNVATVRPEYKIEDELIIASGEVGSILSDKALAHFDRAPTVKLHQGFPIGVIILNVDNKG